MTDARRTLSLAVLGAAILALLAGVALFLLRGAQDRSVFLGLAAVALALGAVEAYLLFGDRARKPRAKAPEEYLLADEAPVLREEVYDIKCGRCGTQFQVSDTLQRPLLALCPVCGAEGIVPVRAPQAEAPPARVVRLKCPRCQQVTEARDTGERPLRARCAGCGATLGLR